MSDFIKNIEIENFKSIRHQMIDGCKRINVFIGYPNVGKSNILEAMSSLSYLQNGYQCPYTDLCRYKSAGQLFFDGDIQKEIKIEINKSQPKHNFKSYIMYMFENAIRLGVFEPASPEITRNGSKLGLNLLRDFYLTGEAVDRISNYSDKDSISIKKFHFKSLFNDTRINGKTLFSPFGENLFEVVQSNPELRKEVVELFKAYDLKLSFDQSANSLMALKTLNDETIFLIPFYLIADTLQRLIFHKAAIMSNENTVLLFEEPEAHMFPPYISSLTGDIIFDKNNNQYFITTHSPFILNGLLEDARGDLSIYALGYKDGETTINRISDEDMHEIYQYGVDMFFNLESYLKNV